MKLFIKVLSHELSPAKFEILDENQNLIYKVYEKKSEWLWENILRLTKFRALMKYTLIIKDLQKDMEIYLERKVSFFKPNYSLLNTDMDLLIKFNYKDFLGREWEIKNKYNELVGKIRINKLFKLGERRVSLFDNQNRIIGFYQWKIRSIFFTKGSICFINLLENKEIFKISLLTFALIDILFVQQR
ncbi:MAG: hypothetical protein ABDH37_04540 [Candidatus Hydrothermales bacterium]